MSVYKQIENSIKYKIVSGELKPDDKLPSVRDLSVHLETNPNTVAKAYRDLEVMRILYTRRGMGVYVSENAAKLCQSECRNELLMKLHEVCSEGKAAGMKKQELERILRVSYEFDGHPYGEVPDEVYKAAKVTGSKRDR